MSEELSLKKESRKEWYQGVEEGNKITHENLKLGCLLRIADSIENIEKPFKDILSEYERFKKIACERYAKIKKQENQIRGLKGYIKRLKKK